MVGILFTNRVMSNWQQLRHNDSKAEPSFCVNVLEEFASLSSPVDDSDDSDTDGTDDTDDDAQHVQVVSDLLSAKGHDVPFKEDLICRNDVVKVRRDIRSVFSKIAMAVFTVFIDKHVLAKMSREKLVAELDSFTKDTLSDICEDETVGRWIVQLAVSLSHGGRTRSRAHLKTNVDIDELTSSDIAEVLIVNINKILKNRGVQASDLAKENGRKAYKRKLKLVSEAKSANKAKPKQTEPMKVKRAKTGVYSEVRTYV